MAKTSECRDYRAFHNWQPPQPGALVVIGICDMPTPGYRITLKRAVPQGYNPEILLLEKKVIPPDGWVPQVKTATPVFCREVTATEYKQVQIVPDNVTIDIEDVH